MLNLKKLLILFFVLNINFFYAVKVNKEFISTERFANFNFVIRNWTSRNIILYTKRACLLEGKKREFKQEEDVKLLSPGAQVIESYKDNSLYFDNCSLISIGVSYEKSYLTKNSLHELKKNSSSYLKNFIENYKLLNQKIEWSIEKIIKKIKQDNKILNNLKLILEIYEDKNYNLQLKLIT